MEKFQAFVVFFYIFLLTYIGSGGLDVPFSICSH